MSSIKSFAATLVAALLLGALQAGPVRAAPEGSAEPSQWQHHEASTSYFGQTVTFTCSGIEDSVKRLLLQFGARPDLKVQASCPDPIRPVRTATVHTDFYSLAPAPSAGADTVAGHWVEVQLRPRDISGSNECELVAQFKDLLTKSFSLRDLKYQTACTPYEATLVDYSVQAQVLEPIAKAVAEK